MDDGKSGRLTRKLEAELGSDVMGALRDPSVVEIMLNSDGKLWVERFGEPMRCVGFMSAVNAESAMGSIADALHTTVTRDSPILEGELPLDGSRFEGLIPPVVAAPTFTIRKKAVKVFTLGDYHSSGILRSRTTLKNLQTSPQPPVEDGYLAIMQWGIRHHKNILVVGGTGSGKTTFTNAVIDGISTISPEDRLVIIEDTGEIQCSADNYVTLRSTVNVSMQQLLRATMRLRPDRILVGEVRGGEALALLKAWNTGHPGGVATIHANGAEAGLVRMEQLVSESGMTVGVPVLIGEAVDMVVFIQKTRDVAAGRVVSEILLVDGWDKDTGYQVRSV
ncbi:MAG: P-type conjugative transfer ATPase TrbB [Thiothrix lacustris]|uniref:P-type conjugative transfer ATPase TrbB n=1 Tax=Thiothrix lacustris TaxID=525917 RepID=A0A1Y1QGI9_9GAMM|nr:MAG: P-type conjugative transfer ATPase TrbB [Thiothrix lacustris]